MVVVTEPPPSFFSVFDSFFSFQANISTLRWSFTYGPGTRVISASPTVSSTLRSAVAETSLPSPVVPGLSALTTTAVLATSDMSVHPSFIQRTGNAAMNSRTPTRKPLIDSARLSPSEWCWTL